ncbi:hypothetical protein ABZ904_08465 [Streptomyces sp. NPDC046900]|uniref:hypothetical protein n=1 Tax=Streptomyces sp. NPDC046900 TaxID=3155473 RepID=UPI0033D188D5
MTLSPVARTASGVIRAAWSQGRIAALSDQAAEALESAQLLQSPETADELDQLRTRVAELEQLLDGKDRTVDEDPIRYALTDKAEAVAGTCGRALSTGEPCPDQPRPHPDVDDVTPRVRKLRWLLAGQRAQTGGAK